jgi:hypothetical protein
MACSRSVRAYPLIDLSLVQQCKGEQTNLVLALTAGISPYGQMPKSPRAPRRFTASARPARGKGAISGASDVS